MDVGRLGKLFPTFVSTYYRYAFPQIIAYPNPSKVCLPLVRSLIHTETHWWHMTPIAELDTNLSVVTYVQDVYTRGSNPSP